MKKTILLHIFYGFMLIACLTQAAETESNFSEREGRLQNHTSFTNSNSPLNKPDLPTSVTSSKPRINKTLPLYSKRSTNSSRLHSNYNQRKSEYTRKKLESHKMIEIDPLYEFVPTQAIIIEAQRVPLEDLESLLEDIEMLLENKEQA